MLKALEIELRITDSEHMEIQWNIKDALLEFLEPRENLTGFLLRNSLYFCC